MAAAAPTGAAAAFPLKFRNAPRARGRPIETAFHSPRRNSAATANRRGRSLRALTAAADGRRYRRRGQEVAGGGGGGRLAGSEAAAPAGPRPPAMSSPREGAAAEAPAWKRALLERKRAKLAAGMGLERGPAPRPGEAPDGREPGAVVAESLGPLRENPFMRLESERRRRRRRRRDACEPAAASPSAPAEPPALSQLLQLYGAMPGIRTIRADNILIIESCDAAAPAGPPRQEGSGRAEAGDARGGTPLRDLLSRGGDPVTEIRAAQVVVYEPAAPPPAASPDSGRVSRLLQKFDRAAKGKGRGGDAPALSVPPPPGSRAARPASPPVVPGSGSNFMQKIGSNSFMVNPRGRPPRMGAASGLSNGLVKPADAPPPSPSGSLGQLGATTIPEAVPSSRTSVASSLLEARVGKPKPEAAVETLPQPLPPSSASPDSRASAGPARPTPLFSSRCSFEIRPAPKPDLTAIPAHDVQARALASLRLNSRNSFLFVPCRKEEAPNQPGPPEALSSLPGEALPVVPEKPAEALVPVTNIDEDLVALVPANMAPLKVLSPRLEGFDVPREGALALEREESALPMYRPLSAGSVLLSRKSTRTFTVVPQKKPPAADSETFNRAWLWEEEEGEEEDRSQTEAKAGALRRELEHVKKRYPTVNEIEVIGGYLSLDKSCMSKSGFRRKKMKISFNEASLQTMFEYPSESSFMEEEEEEEEEYATEVDEKLAFFIPRPSSTMNSSTIDSGLSSHTPKHPLGLSKWQEQQHETQPLSVGSLPPETDLSDQQVMLTPAEKSHLSDFSSEPALYF
ncbi:taperin [Candoia aspera]|uniref:taperin n=1 Tax=Candoia aspera TaxID=51853 RepID=UPI002FD7FD67